MTSDLEQFLNYNLPSYLQMLREMVEINSFTANAQGVNQLGELIAGYFSRLGLEAEFVQSVNPAFGRHLFLQSQPVKGSGAHTAKAPFIALISHLDTVFPPEEEQLHDFHFRREGERIYGPGTVDIKGGTVMIYMILDALRLLQPEIFNSIYWMIALDASEETLSEDFGALCLQRIPENARACLVFEGGTPKRGAFPIVVERKGRAEFHISAEGRGAHAGNFHKQGANAILQLASVLQQIASFTNYSDEITFNPGVISGGSVVNRVPHHAEALVEMRAFSQPVFEAGYQKMLALDGTSTVSSHDGFPCRVSVKALSTNPPWPQNSQTERLFKIWQETGAGLGMRVLPERRGGLSDGNLLWKKAPVLDGLGPAGTNAHCSERSADRSKDQEFVLRPSFISKAILNISAILRLLEM
jgi:glutamate carboxypeptidase